MQFENRNMEAQDTALLPLSRQRVAPESQQARAAYSDADNNQQVTVPPAGSSPPPSPLAEWLRILYNAIQNLEPYTKFLSFLIGTICFQMVLIRLSTLIVALRSPTHEHERWATFIIHTGTCLITSVLSYFIQDSFSINRLKNECRFSTICDAWWLNFVLNFFCVAKPVRYWMYYHKRAARLKEIKTEQLSIPEGTLVTKRSRYTLVELTECDVEDCRANMFEVFLQLVPMAILQTYLLFHSHSQPRIENFRDLFRLVPILAPFYIAVREVCAFQSAKFDLEQSLYIMEYYKSNKRHGMVVYPEGWISAVRILNYVHNFCTLVLRVYTATYFLVRSVWLSLFYMFSVFFVNQVILWLFPQHLMPIHQNPPYGVHTTASYWSDRIWNIFCNVGTRYAFYTNSTVWNTRIPLCILQVFHWAIPLGLTLFIQPYFTSGAMPQLKAENIIVCPGNGTTAHDNYFLKDVEEPLFSSFSLTNLFQLNHMLWLLFIAELASTGVHAFCDLHMRRKKPQSKEPQSQEGESEEPKSEEPYHIPVFPIHTAYAFYATIFKRISKMTGETKLWAFRKLMLATSMKSPEFYSAIRVWYIFPKSKLTNEEVERLTRTTESGSKTPDDQVEAKIRKALDDHRGQSHRFYNDFVEMANILAPNCVEKGSSAETGNGAENISSSEVANDMKIFLRFIALFDRLMCRMTSDRLKRVFEIMEMPVDKEQDKNEILSIEIS